MSKRKRKQPDAEPRHCDDWADDESAPSCLRAYLNRARQPAHGLLSDEPFPTLFATYRGQTWNGISPGTRVRVVMASRMGDVGVSTNLDEPHGYNLRCYVEQLSDFGVSP